jgi:hypothetical protein
MDRTQRHRRIVAAGSLVTLLGEPDGRAILEAEADDASIDDRERLVTRSALDHLLLLHANQERSRAALGFLGTDDVLIVPGFMGSALKDVRGPHGLIWIDPRLFLDDGEVAALELAKYHPGVPEQDLDAGVQIESPGAIPAIYELLRLDLNFRRYDAEIVPFDWRKDIEPSAVLLADRIRNRLGHITRPLHVIAHSQGTLVARRAIQMMGADQARKLVNHLVLLGPASFGTFSAAFALAGSHESFATAQKYGVKLPPNYPAVFQSFTGLYQLLPSNPALFPNNGFDPEQFGAANFWQTGVDKARLKYGFAWGNDIDTSFFNDRTAIILGDQPTVGAAKFAGGALVPDGTSVQGDGTVPDFLAKIPGVQRIYRAPGIDHMTMPMHPSVLAAVRAILRGDAPAIAPLAMTRGDGVPILASPAPQPSVRSRTAGARAASAGAATPKKLAPLRRREPPAPPYRRLRVFSFDPLLATKLETLEIARITINVPWEADGRLGEGPVGEYVEVVDYDPASGCFYAPVDLTHPRLTAQDGLPPSESDPQFHQQMTYAVSMATIATFEKALGRVALWAPHLVRDEDGEVVRAPTEKEYVPRLRIYPHALRDANAYYDPDRHALLFGYFPSREQPGGETLPGGTVFACQSFDIIAHETAHALLHGLHRHYLYPSNPDVLAFHEAFADAVALFQHFSHVDVVRHQLARTRGDLDQENLLGELAWQFGQAMGKRRGALRQYINIEPDASKYATTTEPHDLGAILVAALFLAFRKIYKQRSADLYRIATGGTGKLAEGQIHPDLVARLADEATKAAKHMLIMCVRALDYVPPVDITFGEYVRALVTADYDLVRDDDLHYRVAVIDSFRSWGIYPEGVNVLDESALLWDAPPEWARDALRDVVRTLNLDDWGLRSDRRAAFLRMDENAATVRKWLFTNARQMGDAGQSLGVKVYGTSYQSVPRNTSNPPLPRFEVHSLRPCIRIGPDGEERIDLVAEIVQWRAGFFDEEVQLKVDSAKEPWAFTAKERAGKKRPLLPTATNQPDFWFRGGSTLLIDPRSGEIRYCIKKSILSDSRLARQRAFERQGAFSSTAALYFNKRNRNPFAMLHSDD